MLAQLPEFSQKVTQNQLPLSHSLITTHPSPTLFSTLATSHLIINNIFFSLSIIEFIQKPMKFRQLNSTFPKSPTTFSEHQPNPSPLLDKSITAYTENMRDSIKNSFNDKLALMRNQIRLYDFEENPNKLKATAHVMSIPSLLPPELSFQVAECIRENRMPVRGLEDRRRDSKGENQRRKRTVPTQHTTTTHNHTHHKLLQPIQHSFRHRRGIQQLQCWLRKKLQNPPQTQSQSLQYKNQIMWLGMKQVIRMVKLRCLDQGNFVEEVWQLTWKICQDVILYLSQSMNRMRSEVGRELRVIEGLYGRVGGGSGNNGGGGSMNGGGNTTNGSSEAERVKELETALKKSQDQQRHLNKIIKQLKSQVADQKDNKQSFQNGYMRILQQNIVLQVNNVDKRDWVKKLYKTVKNYKAKVATKMKSSIRTVAVDRARADGQLLCLDGIEVRDLELGLEGEGRGEGQGGREEREGVEVQTEEGTQRKEMAVQTGEESEEEGIREEGGGEEVGKVQEEGVAEGQSPTDQPTQPQQQIPTTQKTFKDAQVNTIMTSRFSLRNDITSSPQQTIPTLSPSPFPTTQTKDACISCLLLQPSKPPTLTSSSCQQQTLKQALSHKVMSNTSGLQFKRNKSSLADPTLQISNQQDSSIQRNQIIEPLRDDMTQSSFVDTGSVVSKKKGDKRKSVNRKFRPSQQLRKPKQSFVQGVKKRQNPSLIEDSLLNNSDNSNIEEDSSKLKGRNPTKSEQKTKKSRSKRDRVTLQQKVLRKFAKGQDKSPQHTVVNLDTKRKFSEAYKKMQNVLKMDRSKFVQSLQSRRSFAKLQSMVIKNQAPTQQQTPYCSRLIDRLSKINFSYLSKIKSSKHDFKDFKQLLKNLSSVPIQSQKNMLSVIQKHLIPVLLQQIRTYKKIKLKNSYSTFCEYMRLQLPLAMTILKKFTQKYGVRALAVKNLRQMLRYVEVLRTRGSREEIIYQLLLEDVVGDMVVCDKLVMYVSVEAFLDGGFSSMAGVEAKVRGFEEGELTLEVVSEVTKPYLPDSGILQLLSSLPNPANLNTLHLCLFSLFNSCKSSKLSSFKKLFQFLSHTQMQNTTTTTITLTRWSNFICSLHLPVTIQLALLKSFLSCCNIRSSLSKYQITQDKWNSFLLRTRFLEWELIQAKVVGEYQQVYLELTKENVLEFMLREDYNQVVMKFVEGAMATEGERQVSREAVEFAWRYLQYLVAKQKVERVLREVIGEISLFDEKELYVSSNTNPYIRFMFDIFHK